MGIEMEDPPDQMSLTALEDRCQREILNFRNGKPYDDRYCLEIFDRATVKGDEEAWALLVRSFRRMVVAWLRSHPRRDSALRYEPEEEYYVDYTFTRFWQSTHNQALKFDTLAAALKYLKLTLHAAITDTLRMHARPVVPLPDPGAGFPDEPVAEEEDDGRELWEVIDSLLPTPREKRVAYLMLHCGLKPREVMERCPGLFDDVKEIYHAHRNVLERLKRHRDQIRWRLSDSEE